VFGCETLQVAGRRCGCELPLTVGITVSLGGLEAWAGTGGGHVNDRRGVGSAHLTARRVVCVRSVWPGWEGAGPRPDPILVTQPPHRAPVCFFGWLWTYGQWCRVDRIPSNATARPVDHRQRRRRALRSPHATCALYSMRAGLRAGGGARGGQLGLPPYLYTTYLITSIEPNPEAERHSTIFRQERRVDSPGGRLGEARATVAPLASPGSPRLRVLSRVLCP
jgi:hypothetical protein